MRSFFCRALVLLLTLTGSMLLTAETDYKPLSESEVLALVAGRALSENIAAEVKLRGLAFRPTGEYRSDLITAGASAQVLAAISSVKISVRLQTPEQPSELESLHLMTHAAVLMRDKRYSEAAKELAGALEARPHSPELGFVMGRLLVDQEEWTSAAMVYTELLRQAPTFPEAHTDLAFVLYRMGMEEEAIAHAKLALARIPDDPRAHATLGLALQAEDKFDAAVVEYKEALRIKPDYAIVHLDLGILYNQRREYENSITECKKAIALEPNNPNFHYYLGRTLDRKGDRESAVREYREVKRLNPQMIAARHDLAVALTELDIDAALAEFRELVTMAPDFELCRVCFANVLHAKGDLAGARIQFGKAEELDPSDSEPHLGLGAIFEEEHRYDQALDEYYEAERLDPNSALPHRALGRTLLAKKHFSEAVDELRLAARLLPSDWQIHDLLAQASVARNDNENAISEYRLAEKLAPKNSTIILDLANLLEKKGDLIGALGEYHYATDAAPNQHTREQYEAAGRRFDQHIQKLRLEGHQAEAAELEARRQALNRPLGHSPESEWQASLDAANKGTFDDQEKALKTAVDLAEKLQPRDERLFNTHERLATLYSNHGQFSQAEAEYRRQLAVGEEVFGATSARNAYPLEQLGTLYFRQKEYGVAEKFFLQAADVNRQTFGPTDQRVGMDLNILGQIYMEQRLFDKAEACFQGTLKIQEANFGSDAFVLGAALDSLGNLYRQWGKLEKAEPYYRRELAVGEKQFGIDSQMLGGALLNLAAVLRDMGRAEEAMQLKKRSETLVPVAQGSH